MKPLHLLWLLFPMAALLLHFSQGETWLAREKAGALRKAALIEERNGRTRSARKLYQNALDATHPGDSPLRTRLRIDVARTSILSGEAFEGTEQMERFLAQRSFKNIPRELRREAVAIQALGLYFAAYALRLDNNESTMWTEEAQQARTLFAGLYRDATQAGAPKEAAIYARNLEASIQLQRFKQAEIALNPPPPASLAARDNSVFRKKLERMER